MYYIDSPYYAVYVTTNETGIQIYVQLCAFNHSRKWTSSVPVSVSNSQSNTYLPSYNVSLSVQLVFQMWRS